MQQTSSTRYPDDGSDRSLERTQLLAKMLFSISLFHSWNKCWYLLVSYFTFLLASPCGKREISIWQKANQPVEGKLLRSTGLASMCMRASTFFVSSLLLKDLTEARNSIFSALIGQLSKCSLVRRLYSSRIFPLNDTKGVMSVILMLISEKNECSDVRFHNMRDWISLDIPARCG